jgi:hypothetical protein
LDYETCGFDPAGQGAWLEAASQSMEIDVSRKTISRCVVLKERLINGFGFAAIAA